MARGDDSEPGGRAETDDEQRRSQEALAAGGIPLAASERLRRMSASGAVGFSSSLSTNEFALLRRLGIRPLTQVMGASVFQHGWRNLPRDVWSNMSGASPWGFGGTGSGGGAWSTEWRQLSEPFNEARTRAFDRLRQEAELIGADAVLGVRLERNGRAFAGEGTIEFAAFGTAVRLPEGLRTGSVVATDLSGQEYVKLAQIGCRPVGVIGQTTATYVASSYQQNRVLGSGNSIFSLSGRANQELTDFTEGFYAARQAAVRDLSRHARELAADGVVGVQIKQEIHPREYEDSNHNTHHDLVVIIHMLGTAITDGHPELPGPAPSLAVSLSARPLSN